MPSAPKAPTSEGRLRRPGERSVQARSAKPSTATENGACRREAPNLPRPRNALMGDDDEAIVQSGESRRPSRPIGPICPTASCYGTSQTCLRVQGVFPPAGAWGSAPHPLHSLLQGAKRRAAVILYIPYFKARNGGRRSRSAAKPQSDRWSPKRFAPIAASLRFPFWQSFSVFLCSPL